MTRIVNTFVVGLFIGGCQTDAGFHELTTFDVWYQEPTDQVDILWVIDDSYSMQAEQETLAVGFSSFALELENTGTDFHLGVITTSFEYDDPHRGALIGEPPVITMADDYLGIFPDRVQVGTGGSGKEKGLEAAAWALSPLMTSGTGANHAFLRADAHLLVVVVSDEDDCSDNGALEDQPNNTACYRHDDLLTPVLEFVDVLENLKVEGSYAQTQVAAIVGPEVEGGCLNAVPGTRYIEAAGYTGGLVGDICQSDWSSILYDLGLNAVGIHTTFEMSHGASEGTLMVFVDDMVIPESTSDGFSYDPEFYTITFHGDTVPERGAVIEAEYKVLPGT